MDPENVQGGLRLRGGGTADKEQLDRTREGATVTDVFSLQRCRDGSRRAYTCHVIILMDAPLHCTAGGVRVYRPQGSVIHPSTGAGFIHRIPRSRAVRDPRMRGNVACPSDPSKEVYDVDTKSRGVLPWMTDTPSPYPSVFTGNMAEQLEKGRGTRRSPCSM